MAANQFSISMPNLLINHSSIIIIWRSFWNWQNNSEFAAHLGSNEILKCLPDRMIWGSNREKPERQVADAKIRRQFALLQTKTCKRSDGLQPKENPLTRFHSAWLQVSSTNCIQQRKKSVCMLRCQLVKVSVSKINQVANGKHINNYTWCQQPWQGKSHFKGIFLVNHTGSWA